MLAYVDVAECATKEELSSVAKHYSDMWNVCHSEEFANLCPEEGTGGNTSLSPAYQENLKRAVHTITIMMIP